jgi:hypothetical protein
MQAFSHRLQPPIGTKFGSAMAATKIPPAKTTTSQPQNFPPDLIRSFSGFISAISNTPGFLRRYFTPLIRRRPQILRPTILFICGRR